MSRRRRRSGRSAWRDAGRSSDRGAVGRPAAAGLPGPGARRGTRPLPARRAGHRRGRDHPGGPDGRPRSGGAAGQDGRRHDPRPGLCRAALPGGGARQPPGHRHGTGRTWSSTSGSWPRRTAATSWSCPTDGARRLVLDDAHHHDEAAGQRAPLPRRGPADGPRRAPRRSDGLRRSCSAGWSRRSWSGVVCAVMGTFVVLKGLAFIGDAVSHAAFPGLVIAYIARRPALPRRRRRRGGHGAGHRLGLASRRAALRHRRRRPVRRHVRAGDRAVQHDRRLRRPTCSATCSATSSGSRSATSSRSRVLGAIVLAVVFVLRKELLYATFDPAGRGRLGAAGRRARVPAAGAARRDDRGQHPGGRDHHGRGDAGHPGGDGAAAGRPASAG